LLPRFHKKSLENLDKGVLYTGFSYNKQQQLIDEIDKSTLDKIWTKGKSFRNTDTIDILNMNVQGKFFSFLKEFSSSNETFKDYANEIEFSYDITPKQSLFFIENFKYLNFTDEVRLIMAIHYLTLNSNNK